MLQISVHCKKSVRCKNAFADRRRLSTSLADGISNALSFPAIWGKDRLAPNSGHGVVINTEYRERAMFEHATTLVNSVNPFLYSFDIDTRSGKRPDRHNHDLTDLITVLAARYPVVRQLAGDESFVGAASGFAFSQPPRKPGNFGDVFPQFLRSFGSSASIEYLADIAELELALSKARNASMQRSKRRAPSPSNGNEARITLHPSVSVVASRFPIVTIWQANQTPEGAMIYRWNAEAALVSAPCGRVEIRRLPTGGAAFFRSLINGATIADAAKAGQSQTPDFNLAANLAILSDARIAANFTATRAA